MKKVVKRRTNIERPFNMGEWTQAQMFGVIRSAIRNAFRYNWNAAKECLKRASRPSQSSNKRLKTEYCCAHCKNKFYPRTEVEVDHKIEVGSLKSFSDVETFLKRFLLEDPDDYQVLCKEHHKVKTKAYMDSKKNGRV